MHDPRITLAALIVLSQGSQAAAFQIKYTDEGLPVRWAPGEVTYHVDPRGGRPVAAAAFAAAVDAAFAAWAGPDTGLDLVPGPDAPGGFGFELGAGNASVVRYAEDEWEHEPDALMLTFTHYRVTDGAILDADILINGVDHDWRADGGRADDDDDFADAAADDFDLQNALTHEVGHFLGLAHSPDHVEAVMYPSTARGELSKRALADDDAAGLFFLYVTLALPGEGPEVQAGCNAGGSAPTALASLGLLLAALGLARWGCRRAGARPARRAAPLGVLVLLALTSGGAGATTLRHRSLAELVRAAEVVVQGRVVEVRAHRVGRLIVTDTTVRVERCLRGACGASLVVRQPGGEVGGVGLHVEGAFRARPGAEVVLFVRRLPAGAFAPIGMAQGVLRVERPRGGPARAVRELQHVVRTPRRGARPAPREVFTLDAVHALIRPNHERRPR